MFSKTVHGSYSRIRLIRAVGAAAALLATTLASTSDAQTGLGSAMAGLNAALKAAPQQAASHVEALRKGPSTTSYTRTKAFADALRASGGLKKPASIGQPRNGRLDALEYYLRQRAFPNNRVPWELVGPAVRHKNRMPRPGPGEGYKGSQIPVEGPKTLALGGPGGGSTWEFLGPRNAKTPGVLPGSFFGLGPGYISGRINAISYVPPIFQGDPIEGIHYVGASSGGVWKSTDNGQNWVPLSDDWPSLETSCIAIDPTNQSVVYVGTGDFHGYASNAQGIMKSTDAGQTWTQIGPVDNNSRLFGGAAVSRIVIDPEHPNWITAATGRGQAGDGYVYQSRDGGQTWNIAFDSRNEWSGLAMGQPFFVFPFSSLDPDGDGIARIYYASGWGEIWSSYNSGQTWAPNPVPSNALLYFNPDLATSVFDPFAVYLLSPGITSGGTTIGDQKIYRSFTAGTTWEDKTGGFPSGNGNSNWGQSWYDYYIGTSMTADANGAQDIVYVGLIDVARSLNSADNWASIGLTYTGNDNLHVDQQGYATHPGDPFESLVSSDGGVYRVNTDQATGAATFDTTLNRTLGVTEFYKIAAHPTDADYTMGGTQDNSTPHSFGKPFAWRVVASGDGGFCAINPNTPRIQYATSQYLTIYRTTDSWTNTSNIAPGYVGDLTEFIAPIALDPSKPRYLYAGSNYLYRWDESLRTWTGKLGSFKMSQNGVVSYIAVSPTDSDRIYVGTSEGEVLMSSNFGATWKRLNRAPLPRRYVTGIAVMPGNKNDILVTLSGFNTKHVWRCPDTRAVTPQWQSASGGGSGALPDIPTNAIALDVVNPVTTWFVGTDIGVFYTTNGGSTWTDGTQVLGLPGVRINDLKAMPGTGYLNAGTYGRGIWRLKLANPAGPIKTIAVAPTTIKGGKFVSITVTLQKGAPQGGQVVLLSTDRPDLINLPESVVVPGGLFSKIISVKTNATLASTKIVLQGIAGGAVAEAKLTIVP